VCVCVCVVPVKCGVNIRSEAKSHFEEQVCLSL
jgi:hypothetical protein